MAAIRLADSALHAALLRRIGAPLPSNEALAEQARKLASGVPGAKAQACIALDRAVAYLYAWCDPANLKDTAIDDAVVALSPHAAWEGRATAEAGYHYVVATDVDADWETELNLWYDEEHMPGLAAVPGNRRSARLRSAGSPRYHSCYDIESPRVLERPEWLAVRRTGWSSRVRPHFRNTVRVMFESILDDR